MRYMTLKESVRCRGIGRFFAILILASSASSCHRAEQLVQLYGEAQGTYYSIQYYDKAHRNLQPALDSILTAVDQVASLWVDSSELRRVNRNEADTVSPMFADLLEKSIQINRYTGGAFDCRIGRIVQMWGFSFRQKEAIDSAMLQSMLTAAHGRILLDDNRVVKQYPSTELDFNAIAQGYTSDIIAHFLDSLDIHNYLIDIGGEVIASGNKASGKPWRVGIERPAENKYDTPEVQTAIPLVDCAVVTSGSYRKYYEKDGIKYSHTIDPTTGLPVAHTLLSVSVVDSSCWLADAMATAYMVMGLDSAMAFIQSHPGGPGTEAVYFIYDSLGHLSTRATPAFQALIEAPQNRAKHN